MVHREEVEEMREKFFEGIDKSKLPTKDEGHGPRI
jgi:hypothetical protein